MIRTLSFLILILTLAPGCKPTGPATTPAPAPAEDDRRLTRDECSAAVEHAITLFTADPAMASAAAMMRDGRDGYISQCEATATLRDHRCLMSARTAHELGLCPMPGRGAS